MLTLEAQSRSGDDRHSAMDMPSRWPSIVSYGPSLRWRFQLVRESEYRREARSLLDDKTLADAAHMRAANRKVNICTSGTGRIGCSTLQCTTTVSFRFVTRLNSVCEPLRGTAGVDLAPGERGPVIPDRELVFGVRWGIPALTGVSLEPQAIAFRKRWTGRSRNFSAHTGDASLRGPG